jgi:hypothetical protein
MKLTTMAIFIGAVVALLGLLGLISGDGRMFGEMNIDLLLDIVRIALGGFLIYGGLKSVELAKTAFFTFGVLYLGMFLVGLIDPQVFGMLPGGLGLIDQALHLVGGIAGVALPYLVKQDRLAV